MADNNDERIDRLIKQLTDKNNSWDTRHSAARSLGDIGDPRAVEPLIKALKDGDKYTRESAAYSLGDIGDLRAVEPLIKALEDEKINVRWSAASILGGIDDSRAVPPLIKALEDGNSAVRRKAADVLEEMPLTATACQEIKSLLLANILTSKDEGVRNISKSLMKKCRGLE